MFDCDPPSLSLSTDELPSDGLTVGVDYLSILGDLPHQAAECASQLDPAACADRDRDGLTDAWEAEALRRLRPIVRFDREEPLFCDNSTTVGMIGRVVPAPEPEHYRAFIAILYSFDYGRCSVAAHRGDVERVVLDLHAVSATEMVITGIYTAAHEYTPFDGGRVVRAEELAGVLELVPGEVGNTRWAIYASSSKHASYLDQRSCADHEALICAREACDPPRSGERHDLLMPILHAGEPDAALTDDDDARYFGPTLEQLEADPWTTAAFCPTAGANRTACGPGAIRDKLLRDPFVDGHPELLRP